MLSNKKFCILFVDENPYTTGHHVLAAFKKLGLNTVFSKPYDRINENADIYLYVDSGFEHPIATPKEKTIFYSIDNYVNGLDLYKKGMHTRFDWWHYVIRSVSMIFDAFEVGYRWFESRNARVVFLSMGYNDDLYYYQPTEKKYDVCFVGSRKTDGLRGEILKIVDKNFRLYSPSTYGDGLRIAALESKCFLDISPEEKDMLGQRFFEGYACQVPMVTMERPSVTHYIDVNNDNGIYTYNTFNLEESLKIAITKAMAHNATINRPTENMKWTSKVKKIIEYAQYIGDK